MATTISFTNYNNEPLSNQQASALGEYVKVYEINSIIKKIEYYYDGEFESVEYFKDDTEKLNDIFTALKTNTLCITQKENINNYTIKISTSYINGIISHTEKELFLDSKMICVHELDANNQLKINDCIKYLYDDNGSETGEEIFNFHYNQDGTLKCIHGVDYPFSEYNQSLDASEISLYFPNLLTDNPYYININFLP